MNPLISERNFIPTFTGELLMKGVSGVTRLFQMEPEDAVTEILIEQVADAELLDASNAWAVKMKFPEAVGIPVIDPSDELRFNPTGSDPDVIEYWYGLTPPLATNPELYTVPTRPLPDGQANATGVGDPEVVNVTSTQ